MDQNAYESAGICEILIPSTLDQSPEPSLFWKGPNDSPTPLLVSLHTWSADRHNTVDAALTMARRNHWHLLMPEFRGPNLVTNPRATQACASKLAMQDVIDAVEFVVQKNNVDRDRIFLMGSSGGGHMAMMLAAYRPKFWRSIAAFVGITDLWAWHSDNPNYSKHIAACCGGAPSETARAQYEARSPIHHAQQIAQVRELVIYHGKYDPSVPFTHAVKMFDAINQIDKKSRVFLNVFDGGHDTLAQSAEAQFNKNIEARGYVTG